jgi:hypothetical protein
VPLALFSFNVGVECGQLAFIAAVAGCVGITRRMRVLDPLERLALRAAPAAIGTLAAFWLFERLVRFAS